MNLRNAFTAVIFLLAIASSAFAQADLTGGVPLAAVDRVQGAVQAGPPTRLGPARPGDILQSGMRVVVPAGGRALLRLLEDRTFATLGPGTTVDLLRRDRGDGQVLRRLLLRTGEAAFGISPGEGRDLRMETATTVASVRGTRFLMRDDGTGATVVEVEDGMVHVYNPFTGETLDVGPGQRAQSDLVGVRFITPVVSVADTLPPQLPPPASLSVDFLHPATGMVRVLEVEHTEASEVVP